MEQLNFKIENFEGPLDLLLHLISRHRMTLTDVKISLLIDQYLAFIGSVGPDELEPTSEFIEMAARLIYMKSAALLPRHDEAEALERELVGQLIEYQGCRQAADKLRYMQEGVFFAVREPLQITQALEYGIVHDKGELGAAFLFFARRLAENPAMIAESFEEIVAAPAVTVASRIIFILRNLRRGVLKNARELFVGAGNRSENVASFLGLLELINAKRITVSKVGTIKTVERG
ncbi:MAG: segregation/condensation protein A [Oscillospiraceae bacterium]|nr:segregation/condensation protein A [Oscillospiraceae bacterium]